ncbi:MAG: glucosaminidase domain-containing protein [Bacteroidales bacterium]
MRKYIWVLAFFMVQCGVQRPATQVNIPRESYINTYADLAMREMLRTGIPASITLAQGCLESNNGNSRLAVSANNHFGIKCHDWKGKRIYHNDDRWRDCFRSYPSVYDSYVDHSLFLTTKPRYASLFELRPDDYRGWANGLKKAGYATASHYARQLIRIIEDNQLYRYDQMVLAGEVGTGTDQGFMASGNGPELSVERTDSAGSPQGTYGSKPGIPGSGSNVTGSGTDLPGGGSNMVRNDLPGSRPVYVNNQIEYIVVRPGDTHESLIRELDLYRNEIYRYNNLGRNQELVPGEVIYLQPKRRKAARGNEVHVVEKGQTMQQISQLYGVKLKHLYRMNLMTEGTQPAEGTELNLRKKKREPLLNRDSERKPFLKRKTGNQSKEEPVEKAEMEFRFEEPDRP